METFKKYLIFSESYGDEYWKMTRREFDRVGFYQHNIFRGDVEGGFKLGIGPNVVLATKGPPMDVMDRQYGTKKGRAVYVVPPDAVFSSRNGMKIKEGWVPRVRVIPQYDYQPLHEAIVEDALMRGVKVPAEVLVDYPSLIEKYNL